MVNSSLERELHLQLQELRPDAQHRVLEFARALALVEAHPRTMNKRDLLALAGTISPEDLKLMSEAIEEGCGQVDLDGW